MKKAASATNIIGIVFLLVGVIVILVSVFISISDAKFREGAESTMAVITDIEVDRYRRNGETHTDHDVYVEYEVDGKTYETLLNYYDSSMFVGQEIEVFYHPEAPGDVRAESFFAPVFLVLFGLVFGIIGGAFVVSNARKIAKHKQLLETGERVTGTITNIDVVTTIEINGCHPYKAVVEVDDYMTGEKYLYSSEQVMDDIYYLVGSSVDVYVDRNDKSKYYVDLDSAVNSDYPAEKVHDYR